LNPVALPYLALARAHGADAGAFLQAQLTADIAALAEGDATFACYCSPRGQTYALLLVCRAGDDFLLAAQHRLLESILKRLRMFVLRAKVDFTLEPGLAVHGLVVDNGTAEPQGKKGQPGSLPSGIDFQPSVTGLRYRIAAASAGATTEAARCKGDEIRRGVVWLTPETSERFIPSMLGLEDIGAVSFHKGCYPGQEIIARARYLGKIKRGPLRLRLQHGLVVPPGTPVRLLYGSGSLEATFIDSGSLRSATDDDEVIALFVAAAPPQPVTGLEYEGRGYSCATM